MVSIPSISCSHNCTGQENKKNQGKNMEEREEKKEKEEKMMEEGRKNEGVGGK
jgi:hypothetical protein